MSDEKELDKATQVRIKQPKAVPDPEKELHAEALTELGALCRALYPRWNEQKFQDYMSKMSRMDLDNVESACADYRDKLQRLNRNKIDTEESYCYACGTAWAPGYMSCIGCGSTDKGEGTARPTIHVSNDTKTFMGPWGLLPWPKTGSVGMFGGPGAGKSSLAAMIRPRVWLTKEQVPKPVGEMFRRLWGGDFMPQVHVVKDADDVRRALSLHYKGPIVLDSATALKLKDGLSASEAMVEWAQTHNDRALIIIQINKEGQAAGYMEIPHLVDAVVNISPDPWGVRSFRINKSRWSSLGATYWGFSKEGQVQVPDFPASYSVEGTPGDYWLHPFPIRGSKWCGLLAAMSADEVLQPRCASAAVRAPYMPHGFVEPMDVHERRSFAEQHGLTWVSPEDYEPKPDDKKK